MARSTSTQISIVTIKNIGDYDVADYTLKLFNQWHIGQQSKNNGVLMLVAMDNHKSNITTGSGLEGALPDIICARILRNEVAPSFKNRRYYEGLSKGADAIIAATKGEYKADANDKKQDIPLWAVIAIIVVIYFVLWLINKMRGGAIIIAGSGMANGGRVRHHLAHNLADPSAHVLFVGYQADGTLGRLLVNGAKRVRLFGADIPVRAQIHTVGGLSAHADQQGLLDWYGTAPNHPPVALVHGENPARAALATQLHARFGTDVTLAQPGMTREI